MYAEQAHTSTATKGETVGDGTTTVAVKYLDLSSLIGETERRVYFRLVCTVDMYFALVESATPATTPTIAATSGDAAMDFVPAGVPEFVVVTPEDPFLAYSADGGILRVRRASPRL